MGGQNQYVAAAAAGALLAIPVLFLLRKQKGEAEGETYTLRSDEGIEARARKLNRQNGGMRS